MRPKAPATVAHHERQRGSATLLVLLLLTFLIGIGFAFRQTMGLEGQAIARLAERRQAAECARAGVEVALSLLRADDSTVDGLADAWVTSPMLSGELAPGATYSVVPSPHLVDNGIVDGDSRLPLNSLPEEVLARLPGLKPAVMPKLLASRGREPFPSVKSFVELAQLDVKAFEQATGSTPARAMTVLRASTKLNVNTASEAALRIVFGSEELARGLVTRRRGADGRDGTADDRPWRSLEEIQTEMGLAAGSLPPLLSVRSTIFTVTSTGEVRSGMIFERSRLSLVVERAPAGLRALACSEP